MTVSSSNRKWAAALTAIVLFGTIRVASTHRTFSATIDEPTHVASSYDWLFGTYTVDPSHPPLQRILTAIPLWLDGVPYSPPLPDPVATGNAILHHDDRYGHNLQRARLGNLVLLIVATLTVAAWGRRAFSPSTGLVAAAIFICTPAILGHAGLATTDMALAATLPLSLFVLDRWLETPSTARSIALGVAIGAGLLSKFSFLLFFPVAAVVVLMVRRKSFTVRAARTAVIAVAVAGIVLWSGYRFETGTISGTNTNARFYLERTVPAPLRDAVLRMSETVPIPAPLFAVGAVLIKFHDDQGHLACLLGERSDRGWWYYFPVLFFFKTPIPLMILIACGSGLMLHYAWRERSLQSAVVLLIPVALMLSVMPSSINIGIRHILPIYAPLAIVAAYAVIAIWQRATIGRPAVPLLLAWLVVGSTVAHPDYLAWFNEFAGDEPGRIASDSNLDWGQDILRLKRVVRQEKIASLRFLSFTTVPLERHGIVAQDMKAWTPYTGWIALSETPYRMWGMSGEFDWLRHYKPRWIGKSIRLYYVPPAAPSP